MEVKRKKTIKRLREEAVADMMDKYGFDIIRARPVYPKHVKVNGKILSGGQASNPYKNYIRNYRRLAWD